MSSSKASLWILAPFWTLTLGSIILILISAAVFFEDYQYYDQDVEYTYIVGFQYSKNRLKEASLAWGIVLVACSVLTLFGNIFSIVFLARRRRVAPAYILFTNVVFFIMWAVILICAFLVAPGWIDLFELIGVCVLIGTSLGQLFYGVVLFHRTRRSKQLPKNKTIDGDGDGDGDGDTAQEASFQHRKS